MTRNTQGSVPPHRPPMQQGESEFEGSAPPPVERETVDLDADVVEWLKAQPLGFRQELNNAARFIMDMSSQPVPPVRPS